MRLFTSLNYFPGTFAVFCHCGNIPVVIAGAKNCLRGKPCKRSYNAVSEGAAGVDMGRIIKKYDDNSLKLRW
jgi:DhnA family fructose-bisphosphate aldolase class Ia